MTEPQHEVLLDTANRLDIPVVDARRLLEGKSTGGIVGKSLLIDHVHPTIHGHQLIAGMLFDELCRQGVAIPIDDWQKRRDKRFADHYDTLDTIYFETAKERLAGLDNWAAGRANRIKKNAN